MNQQDYIEIARILIEAIGGIGLIVAGNKYSVILGLVRMLIDAIEAHGAKDVKQTVKYQSLVLDLEKPLNKILSENGYLGSSGNDNKGETGTNVDASGKNP